MRKELWGRGKNAIWLEFRPVANTYTTLTSPRRHWLQHAVVIIRERGRLGWKGLERDRKRAWALRVAVDELQTTRFGAVLKTYACATFLRDQFYKMRVVRVG